MFPLIGKIIPYRDILYAGLAVGAVIFWFHHNSVEQAIGAARVQRAVAAATAKADAAAKARIATLTRQTAVAQKQVEVTYENALVVAAHQHAADLRRLHDYEVYRQTHGVLGRASSAPAQAAGRPGSFAGLAQVSIQLANALREDDAATEQCWDERAALTGK